MSLLDYICDDPEQLADIVETNCAIAERIGQIKKLAFQLKQAGDTFATGDIVLQASWTALRAAIDDTKIVVSPRVTNLVIPASESIEQGGNDNSTIDGIPEYLGEGFVLVTGEIKSISAETYESLCALTKLSLSDRPSGTNLTAFLISEGRGVTSNKSDADGRYGIPIYNWRISSPSLQGKNTLKTYNISFVMPSNWALKEVTDRCAFDIESLT